MIFFFKLSMPHVAIAAFLQKKARKPQVLKCTHLQTSAQLRRIVRKGFYWVTYLIVEKTVEAWTQSWTTDHKALRYQKDTVHFLTCEQEGKQSPFPFLRIFMRFYPLGSAVAKLSGKPSPTWCSQTASGRFTHPCLNFLISVGETVLAFTSRGRGE